MTEYFVELHEFEVFQILEEFTDAAVDRVAEQALSALPSRHYESQTALKIRLLFASRKVAKYESEITRLMDLNREAGIELSRAFEDGVGYVELPHVTKRKIAMLGKQIEAIKEEAKLFGLKFGWQLVGGIDPDSGEYRFAKIAIRHALGGKVAG